MRRRRLLIGLTLAAGLASVLALRFLGPRHCPFGHGPVTCLVPSGCANCGRASDERTLCARCSRRLGRCRDCGRSLAESLIEAATP